MTASSNLLWHSIEALVLDSDGVLTDGGVFLTESGEDSRRFSIKDGAGLVKLINAGIHVAIISSSPSNAIVHRARQLGIADIFTGERDKTSRLKTLLVEWNVLAVDAAYVGDDVVDLAPMAIVGLPCAVKDAVEIVKAAAKYVTENRGGHGAVREICDLIRPDSAVTSINNMSPSI